MSLSHPTLFPLLSRTFTVTLSQCGYQCQPGYFCDATSLSSVANVCAAGQYSSGGASVCSQCARGYYGNATGLTSPSCSGPCPAGYSCPSGTGALPSLTASASPSPSPSVAPNLLTAAESAALADVYTALDGPHWTVSNGWLATGTVDACNANWAGVVCSNTGPNHVVELRLDGNTLTGTLPSTISALQWLQYVPVCTQCCNVR